MSQNMTSPSFVDRLAGDAALTEAFLTAQIDSGSDVPVRLRDGMRHAALGGGKRFRPFLVMETASLFGISRDGAVTAAAALECVHCYSLVHDDLPAMDNDRLRRGKPTVWAAFDDWTAILVGDALLTLAFELLGRESAHSDAAVRAELVTALARAAGPAGMVGGQCLDLQSDKLGKPEAPDAAYIKHLQSMKTGALIRFACEAGARLGGASTAQREALCAFGDHIGYAFQIADDILDVEGTPEAVGKATGKDSEAGKATLVDLLGLQAAKEQLAATEAAALATLAPFGDRAEGLRAATRFVVTRKN
jgi:farnesyl diphosphate synthase